MLELHYIDSTFAHKFHGSHTAEHVKQAIEEMLNACEIDKQHVHVILCDDVRKKAMQMEVPHTHFSWLYTRVCYHSAASQTHLLT